MCGVSQDVRETVTTERPRPHFILPINTKAFFFLIFFLRRYNSNFLKKKLFGELKVPFTVGVSVIMRSLISLIRLTQLFVLKGIS